MIRMLSSLILLPLLAITGCTQLTVTKLDSQTPEKNDIIPGVRYSLPKTLIAVSSTGEDGSVSFTPEYVPDEDRTYAIDSSSFFATHTLGVEVAHGLLTKVTWNANATGVVVPAVASTADLLQGRQTAQATAAATASAALQAAEEKLADAELEVRLLEAKRDRTTDETAKAALQIEIDLTQIRRDELKRRRDALVPTNASFRTTSGALKPAPAPSLYKVVEEKDGPQLVRINLQGR